MDSGRETYDQALEVWESDEEEEAEEPQVSATAGTASTKFVTFICVFLLTWQTIFRIPNVAIEVIFRFLSLCLLKISEISSSEKIRLIYDIFPDTLAKAQVMQSIDTNNFQKLVVCQKCHSTYEYADLMDSREPPKCSFVRFPRHPQQHMRMKCDEILLKTVRTASGKRLNLPIKVFCYQSIIASIRNLMQQPRMFQLLNHWKARSIPHSVLCDVYDGAVWKSFLSTDNQDMLTLAFLINVDWFQPYKHVAYSVGAIYLTILNLPRQIRYHRENTLVVGVIPGPHEPRLHMNSFLESLVEELLKLWKGVQMPTSQGLKEIKAILLCAACDIPASRKLGGFLGHAAEKGCSRCLKSFPTEKFGEKKDYSGFDRSKWPKRSVEDHKKFGMCWKHANTLSRRREIEQKYGIRFTELLRLPYFDTVRFVVVDPMHNVLLGSAKLLVTLWKDTGVLSAANFDSIQATVNKVITPADIGRIPHKIASQFSSFTADQWKNWTLIYSIIALKPIIPERNYRCWCVFVDACRLLCSRAISQDGIAKLDTLLIRFCQMFECLYGTSSCTPNLHLHGHLKECILDFGPASSFWAFPFERLNGILGAVPTNHKNIETQMMRKFSSNQQILQALENGQDEELQKLFNPFLTSKGSLKHQELPELPLLSELSLSNVETINKSCKLIPPVREGCLDGFKHAAIELKCKEAFGCAYQRTLLIHSYSSAAYIGGELYGSINSIHSNSAMIYAKSSDSSSVIPGVSFQFLKVTVILKDGTDDRTVELCFCALDWLLEHPEKHWFHSPVEVWQKLHILPNAKPNTFIPVSNIVCRCAYLIDVVRFSRVLEEVVTIVVPLNNFSGLDV